MSRTSITTTGLIIYSITLMAFILVMLGLNKIQIVIFDEESFIMFTLSGLIFIVIALIVYSQIRWDEMIDEAIKREAKHEKKI